MNTAETWGVQHMNRNFTSQEKIEEFALKNATTNCICKWLKKNSQTVTSGNDNEYYNLRSKYEPIWKKSGRKEIIYSLCRYGRDSQTLYELFRDTKFPDHQSALLENPAFVRNIGVVDMPSALTNTLSKKEIIELYHLALGDSEHRHLFLKIFQNPNLSADFISDIFKRQEPYNQISDTDLCKVLATLCSPADNYFTKNSQRIRNNNLEESSAQRAANTIIKFIVSILSCPNEKEEDDIKDYIIDAIFSFLQSTKYLETQGCNDPDVLLRINECDEKETKKDSSGLFMSLYEEKDLKLSWIQFELGRRGLDSLLSQERREKLQAFMSHENIKIRKIFYGGSTIYDLYELSDFEIKEILKKAHGSIKRFIDLNPAERSKTFSIRQQSLFDKVPNFLKKDGVDFITALVLNLNHYRTAEARAILRDICEYSDLHLLLMPWPLGNGISKDIFESVVAELREERPQIFKDETLNSVIHNLTYETRLHFKSLAEELRSIEKSVESRHMSSDARAINNEIQKLNKNITELNQKVADLSLAVEKISMNERHSIQGGIFKVFFDKKIK